MGSALRLSTQFLADLDAVCPVAVEKSRAAIFLADLDAVYPAAAQAEPVCEPTDLELTRVAGQLDQFRAEAHRLLREHLDDLPDDDPLRCPVSLFGTMDYGRLETAHTRTLAWLLDPRKEHGFKAKLMEALLLHVVEPRRPMAIEVKRVESEYRIEADAEDAGRLDVLAEGRWNEGTHETAWLMGALTRGP